MGDIVPTAVRHRPVRPRRVMTTTTPASAATAAFEHAFVGMAMLAADGTWLRVNDALCRTLGYTASELRATTYPALVVSSDPATDLGAFADLQMGRVTGYQVEQQLRAGTGAPRWVRASLAAVSGRDASAPGFVIQVEDIDDRRVAEATASTSLGELQRSNTELELFAAVAAHDLQEPLRKIRTFGNRLEELHAAALGDTGVDYLHRMQASAERMQRLIDDLLTYARVSKRGQPFEPVDLDHVLRDVVNDLEARLERSGGRLVVGDLPTIDGDPIQLRQVFQNLLGNAIKFAAPDRPPVVVVEVAWDARPGMTTIQVRDNGIGFDPEYAERIFAPFERLHGRSEYDGTGFGLAIVRRIVERHGGAITADATAGEGARFSISLPTHQPGWHA
jgi:PAS domain S-box-containing protein